MDVVDDERINILATKRRLFYNFQVSGFQALVRDAGGSIVRYRSYNATNLVICASSWTAEKYFEMRSNWATEWHVVGKAFDASFFSELGFLFCVKLVSGTK